MLGENVTIAVGVKKAFRPWKTGRSTKRVTLPKSRFFANIAEKLSDFLIIFIFIDTFISLHHFYFIVSRATGASEQSKFSCIMPSFW